MSLSVVHEEQKSKNDITHLENGIVIDKTRDNDCGNNPVVLCISGCSLALIVVGLIGSSVAYYVFCVISLVRDSHDSIQEKCKDSNLWPFILVILIMNLVVAKSNTNNKEDDSGKICSLITSLIITASLCTWGSLEFWRPCVQDKLSNLLIFTMVKTTLIIEYIVIGIVFIGICYILHKCRDKTTRTINKM